MPILSSLYVSSQWEITLQWNVISHWLGAYTDWSLVLDIVLVLKAESCHDANFVITGGTAGCHRQPPVPPMSTKLASPSRQLLVFNVSYFSVLNLSLFGEMFMQVDNSYCCDTCKIFITITLLWFISDQNDNSTKYDAQMKKRWWRSLKIAAHMIFALIWQGLMMAD